MKKILLFFLLLLSAPAFAQQTVITKPFVVGTTNFSNSITTTDVFQTAIPQNTNRGSCTFQNKGSHDMYVFLGPATSATKALSVLLSSQQAISCVVGSVVLKDEVSVTGTQGDLFYAASQ